MVFRVFQPNLLSSIIFAILSYVFFSPANASIADDFESYSPGNLETQSDWEVYNNHSGTGTLNIFSEDGSQHLVLNGTLERDIEGHEYIGTRYFLPVANMYSDMGFKVRLTDPVTGERLPWCRITIRVHDENGVSYQYHLPHSQFEALDLGEWKDIKVTLESMWHHWESSSKGTDTSFQGPEKVLTNLTWISILVGVDRFALPATANIKLEMDDFELNQTPNIPTLSPFDNYIEVNTPVDFQTSSGVQIKFPSDGFPMDPDLMNKIAYNAGFGMVRGPMVWREIESEEGVFDWTNPDELVSQAAQRGLNVLFLLAFGNEVYWPLEVEYNNTLYPGVDWWREPDSTGCSATDFEWQDATCRGFDKWGPTAPGYVAAFARFAKAAVERYSNNSNVSFEIWNEPTIGFWIGYDPATRCADYGNLVSRCLEEIDSLDLPDNRVYFGSLAGLFSPEVHIVPPVLYDPGQPFSTTDFLTKVIYDDSSGAPVLRPYLQLAKGISFHGYRYNNWPSDDGKVDNPESLIWDLARVRNLVFEAPELSHYELVCSEWGYSPEEWQAASKDVLIGPHEYDLSDAEALKRHASYTIRQMFTSALLGLPFNIVYEMAAYGPSRWVDPDKLYHALLTDDIDDETPAYNAVEVLKNFTSGSELSGKIDMGYVDLHGLLFSNPSFDTAVIWNSRYETTHRIAVKDYRISGQPMPIINMFGNSVTVDRTTEPGFAVIDLTEEMGPVYLIRISGSVPAPISGNICQISDVVNWYGPLVIEGSVTIPYNKTLVLDNSAVVQAMDGSSLSIMGCLKPSGDPYSKAVFQSINQTPSPGDWNGISIESAPEGFTSYLEDVRVEDALIGVDAYKYNTITRVQVLDCDIGVRLNTGYYPKEIVDSYIRGCNIGIEAIGGTILVESCTVESNATGITDNDPTLKDEGSGDPLKLEIKNSTIAGNSINILYQGSTDEFWIGDVAAGKGGGNRILDPASYDISGPKGTFLKAENCYWGAVLGGMRVPLIKGVNVDINPWLEEDPLELKAWDFESIPGQVVISGTFPNPFNPATTIQYSGFASAGIAKIDIFDIRGRLVHHALQRYELGAVSSYAWNGRDRTDREVPSGMYLYRVTCGNQTASGKMSLIK